MAYNYLIISVMISTFCLNFALKKTKVLANGTAPIYLRLTIEGQRIEFTTKRYVSPARWNASAQKMTGTNEEARSFNNYLKTFEQQVYDAHRQLIEGNFPVTVQRLKDKLFGKEVTPEVKTLVPVFKVEILLNLTTTFRRKLTTHSGRN